MLIYIICNIQSNTAKTDEKLEALASDFAVGKPSQDFIVEARRAGATDYSVQPEIDSSKVNTAKAAIETNSDWQVDTYNFQEKANYQSRLNDLEIKFKHLADGSATIRMTVIPPFMRRCCTIHFKDGKVTAVRLFTLD